MSSDLSTMLVQAGKITTEQAEKAKEHAKKNKENFEDALVNIGAVSSQD